MLTLCALQMLVLLLLLLSNSTFTISELAAFDLLNMLFKRDEKSFLYDQLDIQNTCIRHNVQAFN